MNIINVIVKSWKILVGVVFIGLLLTIGFQNKTIKEKEKQRSEAIANNKAYAAENSGLKSNLQVFQFKYDQILYYNDSLNMKMDSIRKKLNIAEKNVKSLQYYKDNFNKKDTIILKDTIFAPGVDIDTTLRDQYYTLGLKLKYPSTLIVNPSFTNEKYIMVSGKKETIDPPSKWFFIRWFQKKQTVAVIDVYDTNPYITTEKKRFIEIIK